MGSRTRIGRRRQLFQRAGSIAVLALAVLGLHGCAHVQPFQREFLADRIMDPAAQNRERGNERHWIETREGAAGGSLGAGGGCACN